MKPLNVFNTAFQSSVCKIGTVQEDVCNLLRGFLSNLIQPELLATTSNEDILSFDYENVANQLSNDELGIGSATRLLIENSDVLEGTEEEKKFFSSVRNFYTECVRKMILKFPFTDITISDLKRYQVTAASVIRLLKRFNNNSIYDVDAILMEFRKYKSLPDSQLPIIASKNALEEF